MERKNISSDARSELLICCYYLRFVFFCFFFFCYAVGLARSAFCIRRIQTFDVRMNGYFRARRRRVCGLTFTSMRITFIEARSTAPVSACRQIHVCVNKHEIFNKLRGVFRKVPKRAPVESNGNGRRSAIQLRAKVRSFSLPQDLPAGISYFVKYQTFPRNHVLAFSA